MHHPWTSRLAHIEQRTELEKEILSLHAKVEGLGAHPTLTDATSALFSAVCAVGAWEDAGRPGAAT